MDIGNTMFRSALLRLAGNRAVEGFALKYGLRLGADKFVAGESLSEALNQIKLLNSKGVTATLDHLGESIQDLAEAAVFREEYVRLLDGIRQTGVDSNISLKPTQMGLAIHAQTAYANIREIVAKAETANNFVRIDMENAPYTDATIAIVRRLHAEGLMNVGTVIQAYLYRTETDIRQLTDERFNLRLVKGAYKEAKNIAYPHMADVNACFLRIIAVRLRSGIYTAIATHDEKIIQWVIVFVRENRIPFTSFEFQMLYGVRMLRQVQLAEAGYKVRCYVPYGKMWYPYFVRRLAERPANVKFILKNMLKR